MQQQRKVKKTSECRKDGITAKKLIEQKRAEERAKSRGQGTKG